MVSDRLFSRTGRCLQRTIVSGALFFHPLEAIVPSMITLVCPLNRLASRNLSVLLPAGAHKIPEVLVLFCKKKLGLFYFSWHTEFINELLLIMF